MNNIKKDIPKNTGGVFGLTDMGSKAGKRPAQDGVDNTA